MADQEQFLEVIDRDKAEQRFHAALDLKPLAVERISLRDALGRVLATNVVAQGDVPSFDRSNLDGYAVQAADTYGASEMAPRSIKLLAESLDAGMAPTVEVRAGEAVAIATGGMLPRGADAILMVEHAEEREGHVLASRAVTPGFGISFAGTDIPTGETVLRAPVALTSRETAVLAALGEAEVDVWRRPRVAVISTGNEIIAPGEPMRAAAVHDCNSQMLADAIREVGGVPSFGDIVADDTEELRAKLHAALAEADVVLLSGGTSKGQGDLCYRVVAELSDPGIIVHGVALKPGKPICMAASGGKPVVILPGFPTSAIFTFHEFVAPVIRALSGRREEPQELVAATMAVQVNSVIGRTEYLLVGLVETADGLSAFPMGKGSGSVTTFSRADGFLTIDRHTEIVEAGKRVAVQLIGRGLELADLVVIGSHCVGLDFLLTKLGERGIRAKLLTVGSSAGLAAAARGECDVAGIHLLDPSTGKYNQDLPTDRVTLVDGYRRSQGIVFRRGDDRFEGRSVKEIIELAKHDASLAMVNRNQGSGTRILIDQLLADARPTGYAVQPSNHSAVVAAIRQHRADWGVAIRAAVPDELSFVPIVDEHYDFVVPFERNDRPAVRAFLEVLSEEATREHLRGMGFTL